VESINVEIKPGYHDGIKITFANRGDEVHGISFMLSHCLSLGFFFFFLVFFLFYMYFLSLLAFSHLGLSKGDVTFVLSELPHDLYKREKSNLVYTTAISIKDALLGPQLKIPLISGMVIYYYFHFILFMLLLFLVALFALRFIILFF
jgi:DnaJ-class molecular chaperone